MTKTLVTGATGNIGGLVVDGLLARGERPRVFVRDIEKAKRWNDRAEIAKGDFDDEASFRAALENVDTLFLLTSGEHIPRLDARAADLAKSAGTKHVVKLSSIDAAQGFGTGVWHVQGEDAIRARGFEPTIVRSTGYMSNALHWSHGIRADGTVRSTTGHGKVPFIHPQDVADVIVLALAGRHAGELLAITGITALSYAEGAAIIGEAIGKSLRWQTESEAELRATLAHTGQSPAMIEALVEVERGIAAGRLSHPEPTVERVLGRAPRDFASWVEENVSAFR